MACTNCGGDQKTYLDDGEDITFTGSGTATDPLRPHLPVASPALALEVRDSTTINFTVYGSGVPGDPIVLTGDTSSAASLRNLGDVTDSAGPLAGEVPVWVGTNAGGHFEFRPVPFTVADTAERDAIPAAALFEGKRVFVQNINIEFRRIGTTWEIADYAQGWGPGYGGDAGAFIGNNGGANGYLAAHGRSVKYHGRLLFGSSAVFGGGVVLGFNATGNHDTHLTTGYGHLDRPGFPSVPVRLKPTGDGFGMYLLWEKADGTLAAVNQLGSLPQSSECIFTVDAITA